MRRRGLDSSGSGCVCVTGRCEQGDEASDSVKGQNFLVHACYWYVLRRTVFDGASFVHYTYLTQVVGHSEMHVLCRTLFFRTEN
jgi:hypothetical protein